MNKTCKTLIKAAGAIAVIAVLATVIVSVLLLNYSITPSEKHGRDSVYTWKKLSRRYPAVYKWTDSLRRAGCIKDTFINAHDGHRHHAVYVRAAAHDDRTAVLVHGYGESWVAMLPQARIYYRLGYNLLLPDLHGNGLSDGDDEQMGWKDRLDVLEWAHVADSLFAPRGKHTRMILHGVSMGAATVMCVSGENTPEYIKCFIEDCGYTSVNDEFSYELSNLFSLPRFPVMPAASAMCRLRWGWWFGDASPVDAVARCRKPMLFIHGSNDTYVPTRMVYPLYKAKPQPKELWIVPGARHARSILLRPEEYAAHIKAFTDKYIGKTLKL